MYQITYFDIDEHQFDVETYETESAAKAALVTFHVSPYVTKITLSKIINYDVSVTFNDTKP